MSDTDELEAWLEGGAILLGIPIAPEWRDSVRQNLNVTRAIAQQVLAFPLPDETDPAPVFRA